MPSRNPRHTSSLRRGFSIIELIVVIGVVMVLLGIFLPALGGARASAKQVKQVSNIRQVGTCIDLYLNDWEETYPIADIRPDWTPLNVSIDDARALGIGKFWGVPIYETEIISKDEFDTIFWESHAFNTVAMYTDPRVMTPTTIPAWENHENSAVKQHWAKYPSDKGLVGVSFVPDSGNEDRLLPGHKLWNNGMSDGPLAPVLWADSSVTRIRHADLREPNPAPIDVWGSELMYTWNGIRGRDK